MIKPRDSIKHPAKTFKNKRPFLQNISGPSIFWSHLVLEAKTFGKVHQPGRYPCLFSKYRPRGWSDLSTSRNGLFHKAPGQVDKNSKAFWYQKETCWLQYVEKKRLIEQPVEVQALPLKTFSQVWDLPDAGPKSNSPKKFQVFLDTWTEVNN